MRAFILGIVIAGLIASSAQAQTPTAAEIAACYWDSVRLCGVDPHDKDPSWGARLRIKLCMLYHRNDVSPRCRAVFAAHGL